MAWNTCKQECLDRHGNPLTEGQHLRVKFCSGRYGETTTVTGTLVAIDQYGGISLKLDHPLSYDAQRFGMQYLKAGDVHYICNALQYNHTRQARVGYYEHKDFEHGHTSFVEPI